MTKESLHAGNAAKMRDALQKCDALLKRITNSALFIDASMGLTIDTINVGNAITEALSAPPRNCDVGTVEEQKKRFRDFCIRSKCDSCPFSEECTLANCAICWSQMPYEEVNK